MRELGNVFLVIWDCVSVWLRQHSPYMEPTLLSVGYIAGLWNSCLPFLAGTWNGQSFRL